MAPSTSASHGLEPDNHHYIPAGCLVCQQTELNDAFRPYSKLLDYQWARFETTTSHDDEGVAVVRVHVLPDDAFNSLISRDDPVLRSKKKDLLASLDYSSSTWQGSSKHGAPMSFPPLISKDDAAQDLLKDNGSGRDTSLLDMFNNIPSPKPDIEMLQDHDSRQAMANLLSGTVEGLKTEMYPYQCRSAALMLQREEEPGHVLDPRLVRVVDQNGEPWYYDPNTGEALREPRHYDRICGGILAEEMGSGKTLIALALIAATKDQPAVIPELYRGGNLSIRPTIGSLMDMAASVVTKNSVSWGRYIDSRYVNCIRAIERNPAWYYLPRPQGTRASRRAQADTNLPPTKILVSHATLIIVPANLLWQWTQEISKHMQGLKVLEMSSKRSRCKPNKIPSIGDLINCDIVICTLARLERIWSIYKRSEADGSHSLDCSLGQVQFKRCIVDEGHKLGNIRLSSVKTDLLQVLEALHINARWIMTGTPAKGMFGMEKNSDNNTSLIESTSATQDTEDLKRIGSIATFYLKARPWSSTTHTHHDTIADWKTYVIQGRRECLTSTLNSLIIRHRLSEISHMLPGVDSKVVRLEGSYQDKLSMNLFSMMIIFNAVQSQRTDRDYFFHPRNRKSMVELVHNLRQAVFFGGSFFSASEIQKSVETAESFLEEKTVPFNESDEALLIAAIGLGRTAVDNRIKTAANTFHEMPIYIDHFPAGCTTTAWSADCRQGDGPMCTNWKLVIAAQKALRPFLASTEGLNTYLNSGSFALTGSQEKNHAIHDAQPPHSASTSRNAEKTLAGNTKLGEDHVSPRRGTLAAVKLKETGIPTPPQTPEEDIEIAAPLAKTQLVSTVSAKLSYLIDAIAMHQKEEQIIVFYDNDNIAWYLAGVLEMLQIHHLIYAKGISVARRAQYVSTFTHSSKFRVLLMDIDEAAFGLDMRSASRIYFISPVLDPQVEAQAIGRVRRISQQKRVTVETLVLKDSIEELILERKTKMTQAEHRRCKTILDDRPIYEWILNAKIIPLPDVDNDDGPAQMAPLAVPHYIFGREFGREVVDPDEDILMEVPAHASAASDKRQGKRPAEDAGLDSDDPTTRPSGSKKKIRIRVRPAKRARFADAEEDDALSSGGAADARQESSVRDILKSTQPPPVAFGDSSAGSSSSQHGVDGGVSQSPVPARPAKRIRFADI